MEEGDETDRIEKNFEQALKAKFEQVQSRFEDNQQDIDFLHPRILKTNISPEENETEKENQKEEPQTD